MDQSLKDQEDKESLLTRFVDYLRDKRWAVERTISSERQILSEVIREFVKEDE